MVDAETGEIDPEACELNGDAKIAERWHWVLMKLPAIGKDSRNEQQNFNFRSIDDVLTKVKPLLAKAGVFILPARQTAHYSEWQGASGKAIHAARVTCDWQIFGVGGDWITAQTVGEAADAFDKATSKAQTAAFKYLLFPALAIADADNDANTPEETRARVPEPKPDLGERVAKLAQNPPPTGADPATMKQVNKIRIDCRDLGYAEEGTEIVDAVNSFGDPGWPGSLIKLEKWQASRLIDKLNA